MLLFGGMEGVTQYLKADASVMGGGMVAWQGPYILWSVYTVGIKNDSGASNSHKFTFF